MNEVTVTPREGEIVVSLSGEIHSGNADEFLSEVTNAYRAAPGNIVFRCAELSFIDSTALGTFVKIRKMAAQDGFVVRLQEVQPRIKKLFLICRLDLIMEIEE